MRDFIGSRFGRLRVENELDRRVFPSGQTQRQFLCLCDCGASIKSTYSNLTRNHTTSCGCYRNDVLAKQRTTHGATRERSPTPEYSAWGSMINRCENKNGQDYTDYGGRGINVCKRWRNSFEAFLEDMGERPTAVHSIDRINNNGNYEPGNCRWATKSEQARNRRKARKR